MHQTVQKVGSLRDGDLLLISADLLWQLRCCRKKVMLQGVSAISVGFAGSIKRVEILFSFV